MASNFSASLTQASDEAKEMYCEECDRHSKAYVIAVAFCVECVEYKCKTCREYHRRHFKTHKIQDSDSMPQDFYFEKCSTHPQHLIKFYCTKCDKEACQECKDNEHVKCGDVNHLPTIVSGLLKSDELKDFQQNLDKMFADIKNTEEILKARYEIVDKKEEKATEACKNHTDKLIAVYKQQHQDQIDAFDKKMEETIAKLEKERWELVQELSEKERKFKNKITKAETDMGEKIVCTNTEFKDLRTKHLTLVDNLKTFAVDLEQAQKQGQNCKLFIKMKFTQQLLKNLHRNNEQIQRAYIQRFKFETPDIQPTEQSIVSETRFFTFEIIHASAVERRVVFDFDINCQIELISSLLVLSEDTLLILDWTKCSLVIYKPGTSQATCMDEIKFVENPWDITKVSEHKVAVTFPNEKKIRLITFSEDMKVLKITEIQGNGLCAGIAYMYKNNTLVVSYWKPGNVKILNMSGKIEKTFDKDDYGQTLFTDPLDLIVSPEIQ